MRVVTTFLIGAALFALALALASPASAIEKVGTTSLQVLKIPVGVRGIAMGNAQVADCHDADAVWWNPGALTDMKGYQVSLSRVNMPADVQINSLVVGGKWGDYSALTVHAISLMTDDMPVRTWERPQGTGAYFNASDVVLGLSYARQLTDKFSIGGNVRYLRSSLAETTYRGASVDLGTLYKTSLRSMRLAMCIQNLGPDVKYSGTFADYRNRIKHGGELVEQEYEGAALPTIFRLGIAFDLFELFAAAGKPDHGASLAIEMNHPNDHRERLNMGTEYSYKNTLFLRAGGKIGYDEESFTLGFGLKFVPVFGKSPVKFDYAYAHTGRFAEAVDDFAGQPHRISLGLEW